MKWTLLVVVALLSTPVFAKGKARARAENAEAAAQKAMAEGEFERALTLLDQAVAKAPAGDRARLHLLSAQCRLALQDEERAMGSMTKALESDPTIVPDPNKTGPEVLHLFDKVRQQLAGALTVTANQPEVELFLDGRPIGSAPVKIEIPVGRHTVQAQTADGQKLEEIVVMQVRGEGKIAFALNAPRQPNDEPLVKPTKP
ncbi:MAG: tetratricopeptide repeat protein, partial [Myxococcota bacterium]